MEGEEAGSRLLRLGAIVPELLAHDALIEHERLREFRVDANDLRRIRCPALALVGTGEGAEPLAQAERFMHAVGGPVMRHVFSAEEGADGHCQTGNLAYSAAVSMDWLDELFDNA